MGGVPPASAGAGEGAGLGPEAWARAGAASGAAAGEAGAAASAEGAGAAVFHRRYSVNPSQKRNAWAVALDGCCVGL